MLPKIIELYVWLKIVEFAIAVILGIIVIYLCWIGRKWR